MSDRSLRSTDLNKIQYYAWYRFTLILILCMVIHSSWQCEIHHSVIKYYTIVGQGKMCVVPMFYRLCLHIWRELAIYLQLNECWFVLTYTVHEKLSQCMYYCQHNIEFLTNIITRHMFTFVIPLPWIVDIPCCNNKNCFKILRL